MPEMKWTPAQYKAIVDEGGSLLVSAAAGSGKTAVLVERAVRLIAGDKPIPADRLLILTFTNAAAGELRARIAARLEAEVQARPADTLLRRQRMLLRRAFIGTIDALCQQLVREHFATLNLAPDVAVGDAALLEQLGAGALEQTMEQMYARGGAFKQFASLYGRARSDAEAQKALRALHEFTRTLPHPAGQLRRFAAMYQTEEPLCETLWGNELLAYAHRALLSARRLNQSAQGIAQEDEALLPYLAALAEDEAAISALIAMVQGARWDDAVVYLRGYKFPPFKAIRGYEGGAKDRVRTLRETVKKVFEDLKKYCLACTEAEFCEDRAAAAPMVAALCEAARLYDTLFFEAKLQEKVLDFSDFEHLALRLLQNEDGTRTAAAGEISARYDAVMVDEYQDTNELQNALYECLAHEAGDNLFYVGDVKQSIYRFRKANPGIFLTKKAAWAPHESGRHPAVLTLGHNFRSGQGVIGGVNHIFETLMSPELGDVAYSGDERLIQGGEGGDETGFELRMLQTGTGSDAAYVAAQIRRMVAEGYPVREGDGTRAANYGDFCILLRARRGMLDYTAALEAEGIPVVADMAGELLQTPEVLPLTAALCAIDNPADDVSMAAALLGPLFHFTADELAAIRAGSLGTNIWGALLAAPDAKACATAETLRTLRSLAAGVPVGILCEELCARTGYLSAVAAMEGGAARQGNLLRFIDWARDVSGTGRGGLGSFVRLLSGGRGPMEPPAKSLPGHVTVMTVHKSKGLEFPVCILADAAHAFNKMDLAARVQLHPQYGIGFALRQGDVLYPTLPALAIRGRLAAETLSEEMRVLYVALTRAKDRMILTFPCKDAAKLLTARAAELSAGVADSFLLSRHSSFADWLVTAALLHPGCEPLLQYTGGAIPPVRAPQGGFAMCVEEGGEAGARPDEGYTLTASPNEELKAQVGALFRQSYPRKALSALPRKVSVSALAKQQKSDILKRPSFMYKSGLTAAERGTAQHAFLQHADFAAAAQNTAAEVARLVQQGFLRQDEADALDEKGTARFFSSPLYTRVRAARRVLREYDFITAIPAAELEENLPEALAAQPIMVQGIADLVLVGENGAEIVDYKTDRAADAATLAARYKTQLALYARAVQKRLGLPVTKCTIWSFALGCEIPVETGASGA